MNTLVKAENTAITRKKPSRPLLKAFDLKWVQTMNVLDFGCGKGADVRYMTDTLNIWAEGHDPAHGVHRTRNQYSTVFMNYVLNALDPEQRAAAFKEAWALVERGGCLIVATRRHVSRLAERKGWEQYLDGYWTNKERGMFQAEIDLKYNMQFLPPTLWGPSKFHLSSDFYLAKYWKP